MGVCRRCGRENADDARFCSGCGIELEAAPEAPREERKIVSVLFADLVGFTARAERLDPEDVRATLTPYYARLRAELERFGGTVDKHIGDAVMALFGAPVAHEDDPERAVRAALALQAELAGGPDLQPDDAAGRLRLCIGIHTGPVALGVVGSGGEYTAMGDTVNVASRLEHAAPPGAI